MRLPTVAPYRPAGDPAACANCGAPLPPPRPPYCPQCGQETRLRAPTLAEFAQQFGGAYLSTEGALWRTLWLLLRHPGELTWRYLHGQRKHFVLPLRLYLTVSVIVLLLMRLVPEPPIVVTLAGGAGVAAATQRGSLLTIVLAAAEPAGASGAGDLRIGVMGMAAGVRDGRFFCENLPQWACQRLRARIDVDRATLVREVQQVGRRVLENLGAAMFLLLPSLALWLQLAYRNRGLRYTEHLVFALHLHTVWFIALALTLPGWWWLSAPLVVAVPWSTFVAMRRVYGGRRWPRLLRGGLIALLYAATMVTLTITMALLALVF